MEICLNCLRSRSGEHIFCPWCGFPKGNIGLKQCSKGHIIYETFKNCSFCQQAQNIGKSLLNSKLLERTPTEVVKTGPLDKTLLETGVDVTKMEEGTVDRTVTEDDVDKTRIDKSGVETIMRESGEELIPFFAWVVYIDEEGLPVHDIRLTKEKNIIGKGDDADVRVTGDFVSKLHSLIYFDKDVFYISDLGSTNGTFLNEKKVMKEKLKDGDHIRIGHQPMIFKRVMKKISNQSTVSW